MRNILRSAAAATILCAAAGAISIRGISDAASNVDCVAEWVSVNYTWPSLQSYLEAVGNSSYVPANNIITGVKIWNSTIYVTVPRWRHGVPATLSTVVMPAAGTGDCGASQPLLQPYPSWEFQALDNPAGLKYTQSMEIEPATGLMWMLDVGRLNIYDPEQAPINTSPPKLILYSIPDAAVVQTYLFTDDVAPYSSSFLNDIVLDVTDGIAYISDASGPGAIIVYDRTRNVARRFSDATTAADPSVVIAINSVIYPGISTPSDGIALSPDRTMLFYCALRGQTLYAVPTAALRDFSLSTAAISAQVVNYGYKPPSDGMTFSNTGVLYFGDLNGNRVVQTDLSVKPALQSTLASNYTTMQWQDTFGWVDAPGQLIYTTNRLQLFIAGTLDISGASGANMRIFAASVPGQANYMAGMAPYNPSPSPPPGPPGGAPGGDYQAAHAAAVTLGVLFAFAATAAGGMGLVLYRRRAAAARSGGATADPGYAHL